MKRNIFKQIHFFLNSLRWAIPIFHSFYHVQIVSKHNHSQLSVHSIVCSLSHAYHSQWLVTNCEKISTGNSFSSWYSSFSRSATHGYTKCMSCRLILLQVKGSIQHCFNDSVRFQLLLYVYVCSRAAYLKDGCSIAVHLP